jgi:tRNA/tmRNA/rRNA uracil-C5-methylase (TrmA/RlmC/RlmD family)
LEACPALASDLERVLHRLHHLDVRVPSSRLTLACDVEGRVAAHVMGDQHMPELLQRMEHVVEAVGLCGAVVEDDRGAVRELGDPSLKGIIAAGVAGGPYVHGPATFSQASLEGGKAILDHVVGALSSGPPRSILELFAGAGHLTLGLAEAGHQVFAVEGNPRAHGWLQHNAALSPFSERIGGQQMEISDEPAPPLLEALGEQDFTTLVVDPPRTGFPGLGRLLDKMDMQDGNRRSGPEVCAGSRICPARPFPNRRVC